MIDVALKARPRLRRFTQMLGSPSGSPISTRLWEDAWSFVRHPDASGARRRDSPALNLLTDAARRDPISATPHHKYVPVRLRPADA